LQLVLNFYVVKNCFLDKLWAFCEYLHIQTSVMLGPMWTMSLYDRSCGVYGSWFNNKK